MSDCEINDYSIYSEKDIVMISKDGIALTDSAFIDFRECSVNFKKICGGDGKCVGERDILDFSFAFYTMPKPTVIKFIGNNKFLEFFAKENTTFRFHRLQKEIIVCGYSTRDMS